MFAYNEELKSNSRLRENIIEYVSKIIISLLNSILHRTPHKGSIVAGKHKFIKKNEEPQSVSLYIPPFISRAKCNPLWRPCETCRNNLKECKRLHLRPPWMQELSKACQC